MLGIAALILLAMAGMFSRDWAEYRRAGAEAERTVAFWNPSSACSPPFRMPRPANADTCSPVKKNI